MKIVDAYWEKRNLNMNVAELEFEEGDTIGDFCKADLGKYDFLVAKVPVLKTSLMHELEERNFRFMETQFDMTRDLKEPLSNPMPLERMLSRVSYAEVESEQELENLLGRIDENLFDTDRISIDPVFSKGVGALRYRNWIKDECARNSILSELILNKKPIGFFLVKKIDEKRFSIVLAGLYPEYKDRGLGVAIVGKPLEWARSNNVERLVTRNSSNNLESFRIHLSFGYTVLNITYVFRRVGR